jgi:hypothetical protein
MNDKLSFAECRPLIEFLEHRICDIGLRAGLIRFTLPYGHQSGDVA